jgi:hypothetical protein
LGMASTYSSAQSDHGRGGVRIALVGVINLISELYPGDQSLARPLNELLYALADLDNGKVVPLLKPTKVFNSPGNSLTNDLFRAIPAAAMTLLVKGGGISRNDAARDIASRLTKLGYRDSSGNRFTGAQIAKWREKMMTERAAENMAVARYQLALEWVKAKETCEAVEFLLRSMPAFHPPNFPKKLPS